MMASAHDPSNTNICYNCPNCDPTAIMLPNSDHSYQKGRGVVLFLNVAFVSKTL
ncbi:hypothetical protein JOC69_000537 [Heliobacterium gestii]|nr:hypothetical protein [Heliomicrobium gestii]